MGDAIELVLNAKEYIRGYLPVVYLHKLDRLKYEGGNDGGEERCL
jgi:hypothetical protein